MKYLVFILLFCLACVAYIGQMRPDFLNGFFQQQPGCDWSSKTRGLSGIRPTRPTRPTIPTRPKRPKRPTRPTRDCRAQSQIIFAKTHKTGSSSLQNILFRYSEAHGLLLVLPARRGRHMFPLNKAFSPHMAQLYGGKVGHKLSMHTGLINDFAGKVQHIRCSLSVERQRREKPRARLFFLHNTQVNIKTNLAMS